MRDWMPDQVRHDIFSILNCRCNQKNVSKKITHKGDRVEPVVPKKTGEQALSKTPLYFFF
jgi:hypothetical protein